MQDTTEALTLLSSAYSGCRSPQAIQLQGDGSDRKIYRFQKGSHSWIGVVHMDRAENEAFLFLSRHFKKLNIPVPDIYAEDLDRHCYLLEDLGNLVLSELVSPSKAQTPPNNADTFSVYQKVIDWMPALQFEAHQGLDYRFCTEKKVLDQNAFQEDLNYFLNHFWKIF